MANRNLSRDQKRRQKLARRAASHPQQHGDPAAYRTQKYVMAIMRAEVGIHEADVMLQGAITDRDVEASLEELIHELRTTAEPLSAASEATLQGDTAMIVWSVKRNWQDLFAKQPRHGNAELVGVLGVIRDSVRKWSTSGGGPRAYLEYIRGFLGQMGVQMTPAPLLGGR